MQFASVSKEVLWCNRESMGTATKAADFKPNASHVTASKSVLLFPLHAMLLLFRRDVILVLISSQRAVEF